MSNDNKQTEEHDKQNKEKEKLITSAIPPKTYPKIRQNFIPYPVCIIFLFWICLLDHF